MATPAVAPPQFCRNAEPCWCRPGQAPLLERGAYAGLAPTLRNRVSRIASVRAAWTALQHTCPVLGRSPSGFLVGLGNMGWVRAHIPMPTGSHAQAMAKNAIDKASLDSPPIVYNRSQERSEALVREVPADKIVVASSIGEGVAKADIVWTVLSNDPVVEAVVDEALASADSHTGRLFIQTPGRGPRRRLCGRSRVWRAGHGPHRTADRRSCRPRRGCRPCTPAFQGCDVPRRDRAARCAPGARGPAQGHRQHVHLQHA